MNRTQLKIIFLCILLYTPLHSRSQQGFIKIFNNPERMLANAITANENNELFFAGNIDGEDDLFFLKADSSCSPIWSKELNGIAQTCEKVIYKDGYYYAYGSTKSFNRKRQLYLAKL